MTSAGTTHTTPENMTLENTTLENTTIENTTIENAPEPSNDKTLPEQPAAVPAAPAAPYDGSVWGRPPAGSGPVPTAFGTADAAPRRRWPERVRTKVAAVL